MEKAKQLSELSEQEFNQLKATGLLKSIYPDSPDTFEQIKGRRPTPKDNPNFEPLVKMCEDYLDSLQNPNEHFSDAKQYIFEKAIDCVYGDNNESEIWDFINNNDDL